MDNYIRQVKIDDDDDEFKIEAMAGQRCPAWLGHVGWPVGFAEAHMFMLDRFASVRSLCSSSPAPSPSFLVSIAQWSYVVSIIIIIIIIIINFILL